MSNREFGSDDLRKIGGAEELRVASSRADGSLRPYITIWVVRVDDAVYIRSANGVDNPWFRRASASGTGSIQAGGVEADVRFDRVEDAVTNAAIDAAYHQKYDRYGPRIVGAVVGATAAGATFRVSPIER